MANRTAAATLSLGPWLESREALNLSCGRVFLPQGRADLPRPGEPWNTPQLLRFSLGVLSRLSDPQVPPTLCNGLNQQCTLEALGDSSPQSQGRPRGRVSAKLHSQVSVVQRPWPSGPSHEAVRGGSSREHPGAVWLVPSSPEGFSLLPHLLPCLPTPSLGDFYLFGPCQV